MTARALILLLAAWVAFAAAAEPLTLESPNTRISLLELYTSEGCSSCPPADRWLSKLEGDERLWREVVPVAFHVDYWDYIGWPDRFASPRFGQRQKRYARSGRLRSVYTPGFVLGGEEWRSWFLRPVLELATGDPAGRLSLEIEGGDAGALFEPASPTDRRLELHVAVLGFDLETEVRAGENHGRTLEHDFVVLGHRRVALAADGRRHRARFSLPEPRFGSARRAVAAWVSAAGDPYPIQAVGGWIP